jgi:dTDP-glucose 4,6-dehydratase
LFAGSGPQDERVGDALRRAVITGGAGFLGSHLCRRFLRDGHEVICVDNFLTGDIGNVEELLGHDRFRLMRADVTDRLEVSGLVDAVLHFASPASPADYLRLPLETLSAGSTGTLHALELACAKGARFLLASTSETYGDPLQHPQAESYWGNVNPVGPRSVYDEAKRFGETLTTAYRRHKGADTAIVRIFNTFGEYMRPDDGRAIPTFIGQALRGEPLTVSGDGSQTRSVCYVDDLVDGVVRLLDSGEPGPINIGNTQEMPMTELAELIRRLAGSDSEIHFIDRPVDDPAVRCPDITLARTLLGWEPRVPVAAGLERTIRWFREHHATEAVAGPPSAGRR